MKRFMKVLGLSAMLFIAAPADSEVVDRVVAIINDSMITLSELNAATAVAVEKLGVNGSMEKAKLEEVKGSILATLVEQKLVKQAADRAGIEISEREIDNAIEDVKRQNNLTQEKLMLALAQSGLTQKEYREQLKEQIRQVKFINKEFRSKISIQPEDVEDYYRQNMKEFYGEPSYRLNMIFISSGSAVKERVKLVTDGLKAGEDFRQLASHYSDGPNASLGGDLGYIKPGEMDPWLEAAAKGLKPSEVSGRIDRPDGVYFVQLAEYSAPAPAPLADVKGRIYDKLYKKIMDERFEFWLSEVKRYAHIEIRM